MRPGSNRRRASYFLEYFVTDDTISLINGYNGEMVTGVRASHVANVLPCIVFLAASIYLASALWRTRVDVSSTALVISGQDSQAVSAMAALSQQGLHPRELLRNSLEGKLIARALGRTSLETPSLFLTLDSKPYLASGMMGIDDFLNRLSLQTDTLRKGLIAALASLYMSLLFGLAFRFASVMGFIWPLMGMAAVALLPSVCQDCSTGSVVATRLLPLIALSAFTACLLMIAGESIFRTPIAYVFQLMPLAILTGQSVLLAIEPRLCFLCMAVTASCLGTLSVSRAAKETRPLVLLCPPRRLKAFAGALITLSLARHVLGFQNAMTTDASYVAHLSLLNKPIQGTGLAFNLGDAGKVILIHLPNCSHCSDAMRALANKRIEFRPKSPCEGNERQDCFVAEGSLPVPISLIYDARGMIRYYCVGWPLDPSLGLRKMRMTQEEIHEATQSKFARRSAGS